MVDDAKGSSDGLRVDETAGAEPLGNVLGARPRAEAEGERLSLNEAPSAPTSAATATVTDDDGASGPRPDELRLVVPERVLNAASDYSVRKDVGVEMDTEPEAAGSAANVSSKSASGSAVNADSKSKGGFGSKRRLNSKQKSKCKVFVEGINGSIGGHQLRVKFEKFGTVISAKILRDPSTSASRGCGFVTFKSKKSADRAIKMMDGVSWYSQSLRVQSVHELSASTSTATATATATTDPAIMRDGVKDRDCGAEPRSPSVQSTAIHKTASHRRSPSESISMTGSDRHRRSPPMAMTAATDSQRHRPPDSMTQQIDGVAVHETAPNTVTQPVDGDGDRAQNQSAHRFGGGTGSDHHIPPWRPPPPPVAATETIPSPMTSRERSKSYLGPLGLAAEQRPISTHSTASASGSGLLYGGINPLIAAAQFPAFCIPRIVASDSVPIPNPPLLQQSFAAMDAEYRRFKLMNQQIPNTVPIPNVVSQQTDGLPIRPQLRPTIVIEKQSETETAADSKGGADVDTKEGIVPLSPSMAVPADLKSKSMSISQSVSPSHSESKSPPMGHHGVRSFSPPSDRDDAVHSKSGRNRRSLSPDVSDRERDRHRRRRSERSERRYHRRHRRRSRDRMDRSRSRESDDDRDRVRRDRSRSRSRQRERDRMRWRMRMRERMRRSPSPRPYRSRFSRRSRSRSRSRSWSRSRRYSRSPLRSRGRSRRRSRSRTRSRSPRRSRSHRRSRSREREWRSHRSRSRSRHRDKSKNQSNRKEGTVEDGEIIHDLHRRRSSSRSRSRAKVKLSGFPPEYKLRQQTVVETKAAPDIKATKS